MVGDGVRGARIRDKLRFNGQARVPAETKKRRGDWRVRVGREGRSHGGE